MKRRGYLTGLLVAALVFTLMTPAIGQVITLRLADQNPPTGWGTTHALQPWAKKIEEATKNRVKIDIYSSQTLCKGPDTWNAVKTSIADIGWCFHGYWTDMTPVYDVVTLPGLPQRTAEKGSETAWRLYERYPMLQREFKDVKPLVLYTSPPRFIITTKKQVKTLEDMKGLKIRISGGPPTEQMKALKATPVLMTMADIYQSLDKGVIDGTDTSWEAISAYRFYEVVKYYTIASLASTSFSLVMNKQRWDSLPKDIQDVFTSNSGLEASKFFGRNYYDTVEPSAKEQIKKSGHEMNLYTLPAAELERWAKLSGEPIWKEWVKKLERRGVPEAQKILDTTIEMLKK